MSERITHLVNRLHQKRDEAMSYFETITDPTMLVYTDPDWDIRTVYMHLVWSERGLLRLYQNIAEGGEGASTEFDINRYNDSQAGKTAEVPWEQIAPQFEAARAQTIAWVETLDESVLDRVGRHPFVGEDTLERLIKVLYIHPNLHIKDIEAAKERINHG